MTVNSASVSPLIRGGHDTWGAENAGIGGFLSGIGVCLTCLTPSQDINADAHRAWCAIVAPSPETTETVEPLGGCSAS